MPEIYADWKSLEPLTAPVPVGTKCVVIGNTNNHRFACGQIVYRSDYDEPFKNADTYSDGDDYWWLLLVDVALLPADYQAEQKPEPAKVERKVVQIAPLSDREQAVVFALCNDGEIMVFRAEPNCYPKWLKLPPIPQD